MSIFQFYCDTLRFKLVLRLIFLAFLALFLFSCEEAGEGAVIETGLELAVLDNIDEYHFNVKYFKYKKNIIFKNNRLIDKETIDSLQFRWGFRNALSPEEKIYWVQKSDEDYEDVQGISQIVSLDNQFRFIPKSLPTLLNDIQEIEIVLRVFTDQKLIAEASINCPANFVLKVQSPVRISGIILANEGGISFVQDANVYFIKIGSGSIFSKFTDSDGNYEIYLPHMGKYIVVVAKEGYQPSRQQRNIVDNASGVDALLVGDTSFAKGNTYEIQSAGFSVWSSSGGLALDGGQALETNTARDPVPGAQILVYSMDGLAGNQVYISISATDGTYDLPIPSEEMFFSVMPTAPGYTAENPLIFMFPGDPIRPRLSVLEFSKP